MLVGKLLEEGTKRFLRRVAEAAIITAAVEMAIKVGSSLGDKIAGTNDEPQAPQQGGQAIMVAQGQEPLVTVNIVNDSNKDNTSTTKVRQVEPTVEEPSMMGPQLIMMQAPMEGEMEVEEDGGEA